MYIKIYIIQVPKNTIIFLIFKFRQNKSFDQDKKKNNNNNYNNKLRFVNN